MGPSGSGKTTLLNSISGNLVQAKGLCLEGCLLVNGELSKNGVSAVNHAYVKQDDIFYTQMTVKETLDFHAKLRVSCVDIWRPTQSKLLVYRLSDILHLTRPRPCVLLF
jgi:ABC-type multidrug transport system ATPase subunit